MEQERKFHHPPEADSGTQSRGHAGLQESVLNGRNGRIREISRLKEPISADNGGKTDAADSR